jgi:hypothetical protein
MTKRKMLKPQLGQWVRVWYVDAGARDGIAVAVDGMTFQVFFPQCGEVHTENLDQIVALGPELAFPQF